VSIGVVISNLFHNKFPICYSFNSGSHLALFVRGTFSTRAFMCSLFRFGEFCIPNCILLIHREGGGGVQSQHCSSYSTCTALWQCLTVEYRRAEQHY
jgi:hypothetical protein